MAPARDADLACRDRADVRGRPALGALARARRLLRRHSGRGGFRRAPGAEADRRGARRVVRLALRIASPYVIYALIVNLALALINRLTPQVQVFFVATPFVVAGGAGRCSISQSSRRSRPSSSASARGSISGWAMRKRVDSLARIGRVQAQMHDLGRWRLHSLEQRAGGTRATISRRSSRRWSRTSSPMAPRRGWPRAASAPCRAARSTRPRP